MIKTVIIGGATPVAGELIRILINHPDIDLLQVESDEKVGYDVADFHSGLIGETDLKFTSNLDVEKSDVIFVCDTSPLPEIDDEKRVVCFFPPDKYKEKFVYGLPEMNRKAMVRGATCAVMPSAQAMLAILALLPLARHLLLRGKIDITIGLPSSITDYDIVDEVKREIGELQNNLDAEFNIHTERISSDRVMTVKCCLDLGVDVGELARVYDEQYDDHNFTFRINRQPRIADVEGTNKCLIYLDKKDDTKTCIWAAYDAVVKGNAGTAVHCMNLLFGLHELTGLALKASRLGWDTID